MASQSHTQKLRIVVIHGYVQSAATVANNTQHLREELSDFAELVYVDGPPPQPHWGSSRPWWFLGNSLEIREDGPARWNETVAWWSNHLSENQYDGIIGLSQGSAMTALLISMLHKREGSTPIFKPTIVQPIKLAILCSGFVSHLPPHEQIYNIPEDLPSLHTVDNNDSIVPAERTIELRKLFKTSRVEYHNEGHAIPVGGDWPKIFKAFMLDAVAKSTGISA